MACLNINYDKSSASIEEVEFKLLLINAISRYLKNDCVLLKAY